jgi:hypothetical protein
VKKRPAPEQEPLRVAVAVRRRPKACGICGGTATIDAVDNFGRPYKGCANCRILSLDEIERIERTEGQSARGIAGPSRPDLEHVAEILAVLAGAVALDGVGLAHGKERQEIAALARAAAWAFAELGQTREGEPLEATCLRLLDQYNARCVADRAKARS